MSTDNPDCSHCNTQWHAASARPLAAAGPHNTQLLQAHSVGPASGGDQLPPTRFPGPLARGLLGTCATIAREEGAGALWKGLEPGLHRQVMYGGLRIGLYEPVSRHPWRAARGGGGSALRRSVRGRSLGALAP